VAVIDVVLGDITGEQVDAVVTAANESLLGGGGVDGAIHRAAGPGLAGAGSAIAPCDPGDAKVTLAFNMDPPVRYVIHTVGPVWDGGGHGEDEVLASTARRPRPNPPARATRPARNRRVIGPTGNPASGVGWVTVVNGWPAGSSRTSQRGSGW
jgi:Macro domain